MVFQPPLFRGYVYFRESIVICPDVTIPAASQSCDFASRRLWEGKEHFHRSWVVSRKSQQIWGARCLLIMNNSERFLIQSQFNPRNLLKTHPSKHSGLLDHLVTQILSIISAPQKPWAVLKPLDLFKAVIFYGLYHGKSTPFIENLHLGEYFFRSFSRASKSFKSKWAMKKPLLFRVFLGIIVPSYVRIIS